MDAIVVYESVYGNTRAVAEAVADGLGGVPVLPVREAARRDGPVDLLVIGGPTHMHGLASTRSRQAAVDEAEEKRAVHIDPYAMASPGLRSWLRELSPDVVRQAAAFDTRLDKAPWLTGAAARSIARRLHWRGIDVLATESFLVEGSEGPLQAGEVERARAWGAKLAESIRQTTGSPVAADPPVAAHA
jgi:menaquinone-dependent protoporphyrinogen IX oxidase